MCLLSRQNRLKKSRSLLRRQLKMCLLPHNQPPQELIRLGLSRAGWIQGPCAIRVIRGGQCRHVRWVQGSRLVSRLTGYPVQFNKAVVGRNAFAHEAGIHQHGMLEDRTTYEIMDPTAVGQDTSLVLGKHSGRHAFSDALEKSAKVEPITFDYDGKKVEGYRIEVTPYANDGKASKMEGWENAQFDIVMSDNVPGEVVQMVSSYENKHNKELRLEERYTLSGVEGLK